jgi:hypothetical protein
VGIASAAGIASVGDKMGTFREVDNASALDIVSALDIPYTVGMLDIHCIPGIPLIQDIASLDIQGIASARGILCSILDLHTVVEVDIQCTALAVDIEFVMVVDLMSCCWDYSDHICVGDRGSHSCSFKLCNMY